MVLSREAARGLLSVLQGHRGGGVQHACPSWEIILSLVNPLPVSLPL